MKANDRARLTTALRDHVAKIAADLRAKMRAPGAARVAAEQLHRDERVAEDFEVWTDLLSRRAAVLWVLRSVYVRVLEDRGLLAPGRLLDPEAQQLFERLAPNLGETAFLRWIFKDLASTRGGVPELFSPQPAEVALPSDELSRALIAFWRHRDADTGAVWSFAEEKFEGELMGDLYQELDPVVKDRFALCQTPDFVRAFILDRTLTPAIEIFGADEVRLLDPACGSGHFLIDALKRLVAATAEKHNDWSREKVVTHALDRVVGIDLNDYACALARTRLIMTAAELAGVTKLADAARFHPHVYWADGLEQVEKDEQKPSLQFSLFEKVEERPRATLTRSDVRAALKKVFEKKFHAVVANPPFSNEPDPGRREYHKVKIGRAPRYSSAKGRYSLCAPFIERCFQLAAPNSYVGVIVGNNFMTRAFGKPLIEKVLASRELSMIVDSSGAILAPSGFETPTVMLFARNSAPSSRALRVVRGKKGDTTRFDDCSKGAVWQSIIEGWNTRGFENEYISTDDAEREDFSRYPWSLAGGGVGDLKHQIEARAEYRLGAIATIGVGGMSNADEIFIRDAEAWQRAGVDDKWHRSLLVGEDVRDWSQASDLRVFFPYSRSLELMPLSSPAANALWPFRTALWSRAVFGGGTYKSAGRPWYEWHQVTKDRYSTPLALAYAAVATHCHFIVERGQHVFKQTAHLIKLDATASLDDYLAVAGLLNSSVLNFWARHTLHRVGGRSSGTKRQSESWAQRLDFAAKLIAQAPIVKCARERVIALAKKLDELGRIADEHRPKAVLAGDRLPNELADALARAHELVIRTRASMVALQEELDWTCYAAFGLVHQDAALDVDQIEPIQSQHRPFAIRLAQMAEEGDATKYWFEAAGVSPVSEIPTCYAVATRERMQRRLELAESDEVVGLLEAPEYKRRWEPIEWSEQLDTALFDWLAARIEQTLAQRATPTTAAHIVGAIQDDDRFLAAASIFQKRRDVDVSGLVQDILADQSVPTCPTHVYTLSGLAKRAAWEAVWAKQRREDAGEDVGEDVGDVASCPEYSQGSRGKSTDFLRTEYWQLRGRLDVPKERFIAFTEVPGRTGVETLYGWAGWTAQQRVKAILAIDEELEDASVPLADRIGLLDSAWRLLPDVAREDAAAANRLKAELQALVGPEGPSSALIEDWKKRFPPPSARAAGARKAATSAVEEDESLDDLPSVIPSVSDEEHAAILIWALLHASGGTATRMDLARAFALRARPALLKKLAPASLKREVAQWASIVGSRSVKAGLLASTLNALAARDGVSLGTDSERRSTVSASPHTPSEAQIDPWFLFEANLALKVLRAQPEEKFTAIDKALTGADRKLLEDAA